MNFEFFLIVSFYGLSFLSLRPYLLSVKLGLEKLLRNDAIYR